jgi:PAS domain S-box-containing protein
VPEGPNSMAENARLEESLTSNGRARLLIEAIYDYAIYMLDPTGLITSWNAGAQRFKGYAEAEVLGTSFSRFYVEKDRAAGVPARALETAAREGRFESEGWRVRKDGSRFWAHVVIDPIRLPSGDLVGFAKITRDLTERREAQRVLDRTRDALVQSQKMDAIGQLTGGIAHDFNNLLMAILSSHQLMRKRVGDDAKMMLLLDNATQAAQRGVSLTQRMLAFARRQELKPAQVDVPTIVRGMIDLFRRTLGPSIAIETDLPFSLEPVLLDANQLEMALLNLAVNARDAMLQGGTLTIGARAEDVSAGHRTTLPTGRYVCLSVTDTGEGMDEGTLARAIEPFFTTKGVGKGSGLGLSMVHGLAEQLEGKLILKSKRGEGTTAEIWLPTSEIGETAPVAPRDNDAVNINPGVILAVDDDPLVLMNTSLMLEDLGHTVLTAVSGKQALETLRREQKVDLVIADQAMPVMTGTELIEEIRKQWPDLPVILATGYAQLPPGAAPEIKLAKPFGQDELARAVAEALRRQR